MKHLSLSLSLTIMASGSLLGALVYIKQGLPKNLHFHSGHQRNARPRGYLERGICHRSRVMSLKFEGCRFPSWAGPNVCADLSHA